MASHAADSTASFTTMIASLPKPTTLEFSYPKEWSPESTGVFGALVDGQILGAAASAGAHIANEGAGGKASAAYRDEHKVAINQRNKAIFQDLPFRALSLAWDVIPMDLHHAQAIQEFLHDVKIRSAPTLSKAGAIFEYPEVFALDIASDAGVIFRSDALALTELSLNFTPMGYWSQHVGGYPTKMEFSMNFMELTLAIRENLLDQTLV